MNGLERPLGTPGKSQEAWVAMGLAGFTDSVSGSKAAPGGFILCFSPQLCEPGLEGAFFQTELGVSLGRGGGGLRDLP